MNEFLEWFERSYLRVETGIIGLIAFILGRVVTGWNQRSAVRVSSETALIQTMVGKLEQRVDEGEKRRVEGERRAEERSVKQAEAHRTEIARIEQWYQSQIESGRERETKLREQLAKSDSQLLECVNEKREANQSLARVQIENQKLIGEIAVLKQRVHGVENGQAEAIRRQQETERELKQVKQTTDRLKLPPGGSDYTE